ncbi:MAG TPA: putative quinol monooxygenase [Actinomycetota bacterium]|nr:putative quinol monooxygenase [Actinomycetota bacterium]
MRALLARYRVKPGQAEAVQEALRWMAEAVREQEPSCLLYRVARSLEDPGVFVLYEEYADEAALLAHRETPHFRRLIEGRVVPLLVSREREVLVPVLGPPADSPGPR